MSTIPLGGLQMVSLRERIAELEHQLSVQNAMRGEGGLVSKPVADHESKAAVEALKAQNRQLKMQLEGLQASLSKMTSAAAETSRDRPASHRRARPGSGAGEF